MSKRKLQKEVKKAIIDGIDSYLAEALADHLRDRIGAYYHLLDDQIVVTCDGDTLLIEDADIESDMTEIVSDMTHEWNTPSGLKVLNMLRKRYATCLDIIDDAIKKAKVTQ